jgi:hypothetical protein
VACWSPPGRTSSFNIFVRRDLIDHSSLAWTELRYHWPHIDAALRWQDARGGPTSDFGISPLRQSWQLVLDYYL